MFSTKAVVKVCVCVFERERKTERGEMFDLDLFLRVFGWLNYTHQYY